jgi:CubicO group peptidase (beta-lactamase class C family)
MLMEEGALRLNDPVSRFIPELADLTVAVGRPAGRNRGDGPPPFYTVPASRPITVQDLLTHTSGLASGPISNREAGRVAPQEPGGTLADLIPKLGDAPLEFQPGDRWAYSASRGFDVLLRIVEIASGQSADQFLRARIFDPLGMTDTYFWAPESARSRVAIVYQRTGDGLTRSQNQVGATSQTYFSGGGGLMSTATDYLQFGQMLLNGGELNGVRLLSPSTIDLMSSTHVAEFGFGRISPGLGFGLSVQVVNDPVAANQRVGAGSFGWDGAYGTHFWVDPTEEIVGVVMIQTPNFQVSRDVENALMQAIVD